MKKLLVFSSFFFLMFLTTYGQQNTIYQLFHTNSGSVYDELNSLKVLELYPNGSTGYDLTGNGYKVLVDETGAYPDDYSHLADFLNGNQGYRYGNLSYNLICDGELTDINACLYGNEDCSFCSDCNEIALQCVEKGLSPLWPGSGASDPHATITTKHFGGLNVSGQIIGAAPLAGMFNYSGELNSGGFPNECSTALVGSTDPQYVRDYLLDCAVNYDENILIAGYETSLACGSQISTLKYSHLDYRLNQLKKFNLYVAAGNNQGGTSCSDNFNMEIISNDFFSIADESGQSKNSITIGANPNDRAKVNYFTGTGVDSGGTGVDTNGFGSENGPALDGRIKPDLVTLESWTSNSTPLACGGGVLLNEHWGNLSKCKEAPFGSTIKALLIHTADNSGYVPPTQSFLDNLSETNVLQVGNFLPEFYNTEGYDIEDYENFPSGPNFTSGYGFIDIEEAAHIISDNFDETNNNFLTSIQNGVRLENEEIHKYHIQAKPNEHIKVTLVWNDPTKQDPSSYSCDRLQFTTAQCIVDYDFSSGENICYNPFMSKTLVNDLNLKIIDESLGANNVISLPWTLNYRNPIKPARRNLGDNLNNIEQVFLRNNEIDETKIYTIIVDHPNPLEVIDEYLVVSDESYQDYSLIITGADVISTEVVSGGQTISSVENNAELRDYEIIGKYDNESFLDISTTVDIDGSVLGNKILVEEDIIVSGELNIGNDIEMMFNPNTGIIVQKGGKLIVGENTMLRASDCESSSENRWQGITVRGDWNEEHSPIINIDTYNSIHHGIVIMKSGSVIREARIGINNYNTAIVSGTAENADIADMEIGGGIVYLENANFINNKIGIQMGGLSPNVESSKEASVIKDCTFETALASEADNVIQAVTGIKLIIADNVTITNNTFKSSANATILAEQAIGIISVNSFTDIGDQIQVNGELTADEAKGNTFVDLHKGIDVYNPLSTLGVTNVYGNTFSSVQKGVTLNTSPVTTIEKNEFNSVPCLSNEQSYAIFAQNSSGYDINNNCIQGAGNGCAEQRGVVLSNCYFDENDDGSFEEYSLYGNAFESIKTGIQVDFDNRNVQLRCNEFLGTNNQTDWLITQDGQLDDQGIVGVLDEDSDPLSNQWNNAANAQYHIRNLNTNLPPLNIYHDDPSEPDINKVVNVTVSELLDADNNPILNNCLYDNCGPGKKPEGNGNNNCIKNIGKTIRKNLRTGQLQEAVELLECAGYVWTDKILVATYVGKQNFTKALERLERIPDDKPSNINFKNLFYSVIQEKQDGSGKKTYTDLSTNDFVELADLKEQKPIAESILAGLLGNIYNREAQDISDNADNNLANKLNTFNVYPNPAVNQIKLDVEYTENLGYKIYNLSGRIVKAGKLSENTG